MDITERITELKLLSHEDRERMCINCGLCCFASEFVDGKNVLLENSPCPHLHFAPDGTSSCDCYDTRLVVAWCKELFAAIVDGDLPVGCPYVRGIDNYHGKIIVEGLSSQDYNLWSMYR